MASMSPTDKLLKEKKISEVINTRMIQAPAATPLKDALELMRREKSAYIVVTDDKKVAGMFTETDVAQKVLGKKVDSKLPVRDFMTKSPLVLTPEDTVGKAIDLMAERGFYHIPLVNAKQDLVGILSVRTLIRYLAEFYPSEVYNLPPNPHQVAQTAEGG
jgi:CBS domain-containing protein